MSTIEHPILPTAVAIKQAMDAIFKEAKDVIDMTPYLDEYGRLPFLNLPKLVLGLPASGSSTLTSIIKAMSGRGTLREFIDESVTSIADNAKIGFAPPGIKGDPVNLYLPNCTYIGANAFVAEGETSYTLNYEREIVTNTESFSNVEEIGSCAFGNGDDGVYGHFDFVMPLYFPKLRKIHEKAFWFQNSYRFDITLPLIEEIGAQAFNYVYAYEGSYATARFPNRTMAQIQAMTNFPFGDIRIFVCKDGTFKND